MDNTTIIRNNLNDTLSLVTDILSTTQRDDIRMYIQAGEWGLALETMCDFIYEDDLPLSKKTFELLQEIGTAMQMKSDTWEKLKDLVID